LQGELRDKKGMINTNKKFPDMKALGDYVHSQGLKLGIYSGPGPLTCAGFTASYQYELQDAQRYAEWGIDYLKYDWCSYNKIAKDRSLPELKKPYQVMRDALDKVNRDIVYSLCQYGMGNVWEWGEEVGGNCWRTTGDITDTWSSMSGIGFNQVGHEKFAGPGHWNDPDMLVVGLVGWGPNLHPTNLTPDEQYTHISLWSLLASPLLIGADMSRLDDFTLNLLTNDEVIDISQDPLSRQAMRISNENGKQVWVKDLEDGSKAVGLFFTGNERKNPVDYFQWDGAKSTKITLQGKDIGMNGSFTIRDVWRQKELGVFSSQFGAEVPYHGVVLIKIKSQN
jgi:alpha-galactosidase